MVEKLTETNLDLEERLKNLTDDLADLEALRDLNEELEEERMVTEAELREVGFRTGHGLNYSFKCMIRYLMYNWLFYSFFSVDGQWTLYCVEIIICRILNLQYSNSLISTGG